MAFDATLLKDTEFFKVLKEMAPALDYLPDMIWLSDRRERLLFANQALEAFFGLSVEEWNAAPGLWRSFVHPDLRDQIPHYQNPRSNETIEFSTKIIVKEKQYAIRLRSSRIQILGRTCLIGIIHDETEYRNKEQELIDTSEELERIFNGTQEAIFLIRVEDQQRFVYQRTNATHQRLTGTSEEQIAGKTPVELFGPEFGGILEANFRQCIDNPEPVIYEEELNLPAGNRFWLISLTPIFAENQLISIIGSGRDITAQKIAEEDLRNSKEKYRILADNAQDLICLHTVNAEYEYISPSVETLLGYSPEELIGKSPYSFIHQHDIDIVQRGLHDRVLQGNSPPAISYRIRTKSGNYRWFETRTQPIFDESGEIKNIISASRDITSRKITEENLKRKIVMNQSMAKISARFSGIFSERKAIKETLKEIEDIFRVEAAGLYYSENQDSFMDLNQISFKKELIKEKEKGFGRVIEFEKRFLPRRLAINRFASISRLDKPLVVESVDARHWKTGLQDNEEKILKSYCERYGIKCLVAMPLMPGGHFRGILFIADFRHVHSWHNDDLQVFEVAAAVMGNALERNRIFKQLNQAREKAEAANQAKSYFIANVSHEIRTPLNVILGMAELLSDSKMPVHEREQYLDSIQKNADQLLKLIDDVLDLSRIESGKLETSYHEFSLDSLLDHLEHIVRLKADSKNIEFTIEKPDIKGLFFGDSLRIQQILLNLLMNAVKFTDRGSVNLIIERDDQEHLNFLFKVSDTGTGIPAAFRDEIWNPFAQADVSTTRKYGGTGLGLSISKNLARSMGATLTYESTEGQGSTFYFRISLPYASAEREAEDISSNFDSERPVLMQHENREAGYEQADGKLHNILVVEDHPDNQKLVLAFLKKLGYQFDVAENGQQALDKIEQKKFDAILMDVQMPVLDGYAATRLIREKEQGEQASGLPIIAMTANAMEGDRDKCLHAGMNDYLAKPLKKNDLERMLSRWLQTSFLFIAVFLKDIPPFLGHTWL